MKNFLIFSFIILISGLLSLGYIIIHYGHDLPDYQSLADYDPPTLSRIYASDGHLLAQYAKQKRLYVPITAIPKSLINAFIAAEDKNFYHHFGIDIFGIFRALIHNISNLGSGKSLVGGSTITQQVVKNFFLSNEKSLERKIKEAILALKISSAYSKDRIMEVYLNAIYLGNRSYGVAAAALNYFNKSINELSIEEAATLAALPKAPSKLDPYKNAQKALTRRNWVIEQMLENNFIKEEEATKAISTPLKLSKYKSSKLLNAPFFVDSAVDKINQLFGEKAIFESGLTVHTTIVPKFQNHAEKALIKGLRSYDKRHGWRGPITKIDIKDWPNSLEKIERPKGLKEWKLAVVLSNTNEFSLIGLKDGSTGKIPFKYIKWARHFINQSSLSSKVKYPWNVLSKGDVIAISFVEKKDDINIYALEQIPNVNGAIIAMDPHTGKILAMVGGYDYNKNQFNRVTLAIRQPGSAFKPFVYLAALENGFNPNSLVVDEEVQLSTSENTPFWKPSNHSKRYYGISTLRLGLEKSYNALTVRLAQFLGINKITEIAKRLNISKNPIHDFSSALGSSETTLLNLTNAYAILVNGGKEIKPYTIEDVQNKAGETIYAQDLYKCIKCDIDENTPPLLTKGKNFITPMLIDNREKIIDPISAYQLTSMLKGVIDRGTGKKAKILNRTLAGKTGTTNDGIDTWFIGFSNDLIAGVYVGFDNPRSLGKNEYGATTPLPIWIDFMKNSLNNSTDMPFRFPVGIKLVRTDARTGLPPDPSTPERYIIFEAFKNDPMKKKVYNRPDMKTTEEGFIY